MLGRYNPFTPATILQPQQQQQDKVCELENRITENIAFQTRLETAPQAREELLERIPNQGTRERLAKKLDAEILEEEMSELAKLQGTIILLFHPLLQNSYKVAFTSPFHLPLNPRHYPRE